MAPLVGLPPEQQVNVCLIVLSGFFPIVGWIIACVMANTQPRTARACAIAGTISSCFYVLLPILITIVVFIPNRRRYR
jgi:hypothetical protein